MFMSIVMHWYNHVWKEMVSDDSFLELTWVVTTLKNYGTSTSILQNIFKTLFQSVQTTNSSTWKLFALSLSSNVQKSAYLHACSNNQGCIIWNCNRSVCHSSNPWNGGHFYIIGRRDGYPPAQSCSSLVFKVENLRRQVSYHVPFVATTKTLFLSCQTSWGHHILVYGSDIEWDRDGFCYFITIGLGHQNTGNYIERKWTYSTESQ